MRRIPWITKATYGQTDVALSHRLTYGHIGSIRDVKRLRFLSIKSGGRKYVKSLTCERPLIQKKKGDSFPISLKLPKTIHRKSK